MAAGGRGWVHPGIAVGLMLLPAALALRSVRAGIATAAAGGALVAAPLRRPVAQAAEHVEDRVAEIRAEIHAAAAEAGGSAAGPEVVEIDIVTGHLTGAAEGGAPRLAVAHAAGRRLRLVPAGAHPEAALEALALAIAAFPGVRRAVLRRASGSIVIDAHQPAERLADRLERAGLVELSGPALRPAAAHAAAAMMGWVDGLIRLRSRGATGLDGTIAMGVLAAGVLARDPALAGCEPGQVLAAVLKRRRVGRR